MIGSVRRTETKDYYLVFAKMNNDSHRIFSLANGYQTKCDKDIIVDEIIFTIAKRIVKCLNFHSFLKLIRAAYEKSND